MKLLFICLLTLAACNSQAQLIDSTVCENLERHYDEFEKQTTITTPLLKDCHLSKIISKKGVVYYLSLYADGSTLSVAEKGVKIILSNQQVLSFPMETIDADAADRGWRYSAFIRLTADKLALLKKYRVDKWKLYIYEGWQTTQDAEDFRAMVVCMGTAK